MRPAPVVVGRVDIVVGRAADRIGKIRKDRRGQVAALIPVPDVIHINGPQHDGTTVIIDPV